MKHQLKPIKITKEDWDTGYKKFKQIKAEIDKMKNDEDHIPCWNKDLCEHYVRQGVKIYSQFCPRGCEFYIPKTAFKESYGLYRVNKVFDPKNKEIFDTTKGE